VSLYDRFELLGLDRDDGVKTFEAREIATGRPVKVHLFVQAGAPLQAALLKAVEHLPDEERQRIIDRGKHEGTPYLVTDRLADYPGLSEWVQAASRQAKPKKAALETAGAWKLPQTAAPPAAVVSPLSPPSLNQQFAELFATAERPVLPVDAPAPPRVTPASAPPPTPPPGEFTRMFQAPTVASPDVPRPDVPKPDVPKPDVPKPNAPSPGEFTRMFQSPASVAAQPAAPLPATTGPSDFERLFEPSSPAGPMPRSPEVQQPLAPQAPGHSGPNKVGEFTRMFGKVDVPAAPAPPAAAPAKEPGEFTRMFQASPATTPTPAPTAAQPTPIPQSLPLAPSPPLAAPPAFSQPAGPGEYTRQFSAPAQMTLGQTAASPTPMTSSAPPPFGAQPAMNAAPAPAAPRKNHLPLIIGIAGIVLLAVLIVIFFAMRPK
jgi:hypothetical protein